MLVALIVLTAATPRRRVSPVETAGAVTQSVNETAGDTSRINAKRRAEAGKVYVNSSGYNVYVDTVSGDEWIDSTVLIARVPKMEFPLMDAVAVGVNVWDPLMRAFGQHYGIGELWGELSLHNRYKPVIELGLGAARHRPAGRSFTYRSPLSFYFRAGINYNFLYNSDPAYSVFVGLRYGFSAFSYSIDDVTVDAPYWGESAHFDIATQHGTAGWGEFVAGLRVKLWGPISAGWTVRFKHMIHRGKAPRGEPWYTPGFGTAGLVSGSLSIIYTLPLKRVNKGASVGVNNEAADATAPTPPAESSDSEL